MAKFVCEIGTTDGRVIERQFEAADKEQLRGSLEAQGFFVLRIGRSLQWLPRRQPRSQSGARLLAFNREFLVLVRSGLPILQVLDTLIEQMEVGELRETLTEVREDVKGGSAVSDAFAKHPGCFPHLYVASIRAGEKTGDLPVTLTRYIDYQKRVEAIRAKIRSASFYPILLIVASLGVLAFLLLHVIPSFVTIYADSKVELPLFTRILIAFSERAHQYLPVLIVLALTLVAGWKWALSTPRGQLRFSRLLLRLPFLGELLRDYGIACLGRTLATTLASGTPLVPALRMSRGVLNNRYLEEQAATATLRVEEGSPLSEALKQARFFPPIALRMIGVGESTGALTQMLDDMAEYYESEVDRRLTRLTALIEPVLMVGMGLLIGFVVVAMYIPIFQLAGTVH